MPLWLWRSVRVGLLQDDGSGTDLLRGVHFGFGKVSGGLEGDHLLVGVYGEGRDLGCGNGVLELFEERGQGDGVAGALVVGLAAGSLRDLKEIALAAEAAASAVEACVAVVDGVDGYAGALRVSNGGGDVGTVLV